MGILNIFLGVVSFCLVPLCYSSGSESYLHKLVHPCGGINVYYSPVNEMISMFRNNDVEFMNIHSIYERRLLEHGHAKDDDEYMKRLPFKLPRGNVQKLKKAFANGLVTYATYAHKAIEDEKTWTVIRPNVTGKIYMIMNGIITLLCRLSIGYKTITIQYVKYCTV